MKTGMATRRLILTAVVLGVAIGGCVVEVGPDDGGDGGSSDQTIRIRVINNSNVIVDPEIYIAGTAVGADGLFADGNKFTAFGFASLGLVDGNDSDTFEVDCGSARVIGTKGGRFGDDLNNPQGSGQQIILTQDLSIFCGGTLTLTYSGSGSTFRTDFTVSR